MLVAHGQWAEARVLWAQRGDMAVTVDMAWNLPHVGAMARAQAEADEAWALVREGVPNGPLTEPGTTHFTALDLQCLAARLALDGGEHALARQWLEAHDCWLMWAGDEVCWGRADGQLGWAEYYWALGEPETALRHAERALVHASEPRQPLILLAVHRLIGELDTDAGRYEEAETHLDASLALADACAAPYERALTLLAMAALRAATGTAAVARTLLDQMRAICEPLGAKPALERGDGLAKRLGIM
jgi:tetratricopeptide (TPR) repeat protein